MCADIEFKLSYHPKATQRRAISQVFEWFCQKLQNGNVSQFELGKLAFVAFQKTKCVCRFYIKLKL